MTAEAEGLFGPPTLPPGVTEIVDQSVLDGPPRVFVRWDWDGGAAWSHQRTESAARAACRADYERAMGGAS